MLLVVLVVQLVTQMEVLEQMEEVMVLVVHLHKGVRDLVLLVDLELSS